MGSNQPAERFDLKRRFEFRLGDVEANEFERKTSLDGVSFSQAGAALARLYLRGEVKLQSRDIAAVYAGRSRSA